MMSLCNLVAIVAGISVCSATRSAIGQFGQSMLQLTDVAAKSASAEDVELEEFESWRARFGVRFAGDGASQRRVFAQNLAVIEQHNSLNHSFKMGLNQFSHLTPSEFKALQLTSQSTSTPSFSGLQTSQDSLKWVKTEQKDWRTTNPTFVWDSGRLGRGCPKCGAYFAVADAGTSAISWLTIRTMKQARLLSAQQLLDCTDGDTEHVLSWMMTKNKDLCTDEEYWFTGGHLTGGHKETCRQIECKHEWPKLAYFQIVPRSADAMKKALMSGKVVAAVEADQKTWQAYRSGIINSEDCGVQTDHTVLVEGFDSIEGYWIVKNSWGESWGEKGYIYIGMSSSSPQGICGILTSAYSVTATNWAE